MDSSYDIFTVGHSNRSIGDFIALLKAHDIEVLADIRSVPRSRYNPHFNGDELKKSLAEAGIDYVHLPRLGGLRKARADSPNTGFREGGGFQGYADHMQTPEFTCGLAELIAIAKRRTVMMCAEAQPSQCHRSLTSDALLAHGLRPAHIIDKNTLTPHEMTGFAKVEEGIVTYPAPEPVQSTLF